MLIVTAATPEYMDEAMECRESFESAGFDVLVDLYPSTGDWSLNTRHKAGLIYRLSRQMAEGEMLLWVDADARLVGRTKFDAVWDWPDEPGVYVSQRPSGEVLSGTVLVVAGMAAINVLHGWEYRCTEAAPGPGDQEMLKGATTTLPAEYCAFDLRVDAGEVEEQDAVIFHRQASRRLKAVVNSGGEE